MQNIPRNVGNVISLLQKNGHKAYIVGGCVRDMLLGRTPCDYDVTTSATPEEIMSIFRTTIPTGIKHGTVTVMYCGEPIEVTTFRTDGEYQDNRRPKEVSFVRNIKDDLSRRDFTVNAMAYNKREGIIDLFGGKEDLKKRTLRAVGNPQERFSEDALRILRLFRFSSVLNFKIEENTLASALKLSPSLEKISVERIAAELKKAVSGKNLSAIAPLIDCGALEFLDITKIPDFEILKALRDNNNLAFFTFLYLSSFDLTATAERLKSSNKFKNYCVCLTELFNMKMPQTKYEIKKCLNKYSPEIFEDYLTLYHLFNKTNTTLQKELLAEILTLNEPYLISHLKLGGKDLIALGIEGENIKLTLQFLLERVLQNPKANDEKILKTFIEIP